jgi:hypothetical protein
MGKKVTVRAEKGGREERELDGRDGQPHRAPLLKRFINCNL